MDALTRTLPTTRRGLGDVDSAQPLDLTHPLLDGVEGFWLPLPRTSGASKVYDLVRSNDGILREGANWENASESSFPSVQYPNNSKQPNIEFPLTPLDPFVGNSKTVLSYLRIDSSEDFAGIFSKDNVSSAQWAIRTPQNTQYVGGKESNTSMSFPGVFVLGLRVNYQSGVFTFFLNGEPDGGASTSNINQSSGSHLQTGTSRDTARGISGHQLALAVFSGALSDQKIKQWTGQALRGFPDLLNPRDSVGLLGGGSGPSPISGTAAITDAQEQISAIGQTEVSGTLSVTDGSETLTINGATKVSGTASITDAGEIISAVSSLRDITGTAQITDAAEDVDATGEVKIAGTASLADGTEEVIIVGQNDVTGSLSFADLATQVAAEGAVELQGSLALTDLGESISARERVPARLATVDVRLEDIIVVHAQLTD